MEQRPRINIELTFWDKALEIAGWVFIIFIWTLTIVKYPLLPGTIPTHFNASGSVDNTGGKTMIFLLPAIGTVLFAGLTLLNRYPHMFNYPVPITEENAERQYRIATRLMRYLKIMLVVIFSAIEFQTIRTALGKSAGLWAWFLPATIGMVFLMIALVVSKAVKSK